MRSPACGLFKAIVHASAWPSRAWLRFAAAESITDIDTPAGSMLADLDLGLNASGIHLMFAELQDPSAT